MHYAYDFDNDGVFEVGDGTYAGSSANASETVPAGFLAGGPGAYTVRGRILDKDDGYTDYTTEITVQPPEGDAALLGYWKFDDGSGSTALDSSDYARHGTLSGGAAMTAGGAPITSYANPGSLSVSGASASLVTIPNSAINQLTNNMTVMGWIKPSSLSGIQRVIATARTTSGGWGFGTNANYLYFSTYGVKNYLTLAIHRHDDRPVVPHRCGDG